MGSIRVQVVHPTTRVGGGALDPATELANWKLYTRAVGASNWSLVGGENAMSVLERTVSNVAPGNWEVRVVWTDQYNQTSERVVPATVAIPPAPSPGTVSVTVAS